MSWNSKPRKAVDLKRKQNQGLEPKFFSQISLGAVGLISHSFYMCFIHSFCKETSSTFLFTQWKIAILYPLVLLCFILDTGQKERGYGDLSSSIGLYSSHFFFFFAETVNIAQRSPLMTSKYLNTRYLSRLYCSMTCHPSKGKSLIWPLLISFCVSKNLNQNFTHFQCFTVNEPNVRSTVYSPKQPFHNSPLSSSFKIFNTLKKILYKNIQSNENHLKLLPPNIVFTYGFLSFFMFSSVQLLSRV